MPIPNSRYNLAKDDVIFNSVWSQGLYSLLKWEAGSCFTYDPPQYSGSGLSNGLYFQLGHERLFKDYNNKSMRLSARDSSYLLYSFDIYLHEKGQFWLKKEMDAFGQYGPIFVKPNKEITGTFTVNRIQVLEKPSQPCNTAADYSYTECLRSYVTRNTGCNINEALTKRFNCTSHGLEILLRTLKKIKESTKRNTIMITGCLPKCTTVNYNFQISSEEDVTWRKDWISSFYLNTRTTINYSSVESYSYDEQVLS